MKRVGLFVGINKYENGISQLRCAVNDAYDLSLAFNRNGFDVAFLSNDEGHCDNIRKKMKEMLSGLSSGDIFVFYFAGHGRDVKGAHYLVGPTAESDPELYSCGSLEFSVIRSLTDIPGLYRLFILDCCRTSVFATRADDYVCEKSRNISLTQVISSCSNQAESRPALVLCSCAPGQKAYENKTHGYFTEALLHSVNDKTINCFSQFRDSIKINGTPGVQNVDWQGNTGDWENIQLFERWNLQSGLISEKIDPAKYELPHLKDDIEKILSDLSTELSDDVKKKLEMAQAAEREQDYSNSKKFYEEAKQQLVAINENKIEEEKSFVKQEKSPVKKNKKSTKIVKSDVADNHKQTVIEDSSKEYHDSFERLIAQNVCFSEDYKELLCCPADASILEIPDGVIAINRNAFLNCKKLTRLIIPSSITTVLSGTFSSCEKLRHVTILGHLTNIDEKLFPDGCKITYQSINKKSKPITKKKTEKIPKQADKNSQKNNAAVLFLKGVKKDGLSRYVEAIQFYEKAAELGHPEAQYRLGRIYEGGYRVAKDMMNAEIWYQKAAVQGHEKAIEWLRQKQNCSGEKSKSLISKIVDFLAKK